MYSRSWKHDHQRPEPIPVPHPFPHTSRCLEMGAMTDTKPTDTPRQRWRRRYIARVLFREQKRCIRRRKEWEANYAFAVMWSNQKGNKMGTTVWALVLLLWPYHSALQPTANVIEIDRTSAECSAAMSLHVNQIPKGRGYL